MCYLVDYNKQALSSPLPSLSPSLLSLSSLSPPPSLILLSSSPFLPLSLLSSPSPPPFPFRQKLAFTIKDVASLLTSTQATLTRWNSPGSSWEFRWWPVQWCSHFLNSPHQSELSRYFIVLGSWYVYFVNKHFFGSLNLNLLANDLASSPDCCLQVNWPNYFLPLSKRFSYKWFSRGVAPLPEGKSRGLSLVQLCAKYRLVSTTSSPYQ